MRIETDLDGVLCINPLNRANYRSYRLHFYHTFDQPTKLSRKEFYAIVTRRKIYFKKLTQQWLECHGVQYKKLIMFPNKTKKTNVSLAKFKAKIINELEIRKFYEDDPRIAKYLKENCKNTKIVFVKNR